MNKSFSTFAVWLVLAICAVCWPFHLNAATVTWIGGSGDWDTATNWSTDSLPGTNDDVVIGAGASITVTHSTGIDAVRSVQSEQAFTLSGGTLTVSNTFEADNTFTLAGGTLQNAMVVTTNGGAFVVNGSGTLDGVTVNGVLDVGNTYNFTELTVADGLVLNGTALLGNPTNQTVGAMSFAGTQSLSGNGAVVFGNNLQIGNILLFASAGTTLTIGSGITVHGQNGAVGGPYFWGGAAGAIINEGTISADVAGGTILINGQPFTNLGLIESPAGTLSVAGTVAAGGLGNLLSGNGPLALSGVLTNTGATLALNGSTNVLTLQGGTILGGSVTATSGASLIVNTSGTLDGVTVNGVLDVGNTYNFTELTVTDGLVLNGTALLGNPASQTAGAISFAGTQTLSGNGTVVFGNNPQTGNVLLFASAGTTLTIGSGITVHGENGAVGGPYFWGGAPGVIINQGTISADVTGGTILINGQPFTNLGLIESPAGTLSVAGTVAAGGLGNLLSGSGPLVLSGVLTNTGATLTVDGSTNVLTLHGGTILGGSITPTAGASFIVNGSGTLDGVTVNGVLDVGNTYNFTMLTVADGLVLNGTVLLGNPTNQTVGAISFAGTQTLSGNGTVVFGNNPTGNVLLFASAGTTLTIGSGITVHGQNGAVGGPYFWGGAAGVIINEGTISADVAGGTILINGQPFTNLGLIESPAGTLSVAGTVAADGLGNILSGSGPLTLSGVLTNTGATLALNGSTNVLTLQGGTILGGSITPTGGASLIVNASGTLDGVTMNGVLDVGNSYDSTILTVVDGLVLNGTALVGNPPGQAVGAINFAGTQTLSGNGIVVFGGYFDVRANGLLLLANDGATLTIGSGITIRGINGTIGHSDYYDGRTPNVSVINQGTISSDSGGTIVINALPFTNQGLVESPAGTLNLAGTYNLAGGTLDIGIGGLASFGNITFPSAASFGGTFAVTIQNGFLPNPGDTFRVLNYPASTNAFSCLSGLDLGNGILLQPVFGATELTLVATAYATNASLPQLFLNLTLGGVAITWPDGFPNWTLQTTTNLAAPEWTTVSNTCGNQAIILTNTPQQYFRLQNGN